MTKVIRKGASYAVYRPLREVIKSVFLRPKKNIKNTYRVNLKSGIIDMFKTAGCGLYQKRKPFTFIDDISTISSLADSAVAVSELCGLSSQCHPNECIFRSGKPWGVKISGKGGI